MKVTSSSALVSLHGTQTGSAPHVLASFTRHEDSLLLENLHTFTDSLIHSFSKDVITMNKLLL